MKTSLRKGIVVIFLMIVVLILAAQGFAQPNTNADAKKSLTPKIVIFPAVNAASNLAYDYISPMVMDSFIKTYSDLPGFEIVTDDDLKNHLRSTYTHEDQLFIPEKGRELNEYIHADYMILSQYIIHRNQVLEFFINICHTESLHSYMKFQQKTLWDANQYDKIEQMIAKSKADFIQNLQMIEKSKEIPLKKEEKQFPMAVAIFGPGNANQHLAHFDFENLVPKSLGEEMGKSPSLNIRDIEKVDAVLARMKLSRNEAYENLDICSVLAQRTESAFVIVSRYFFKDNYFWIQFNVFAKASNDFEMNYVANNFTQETFQQALDRTAQDFHIQFMLRFLPDQFIAEADGYYASKDFQTAKTYYEIALNHDLSNPSIWAKLGYIYQNYVEPTDDIKILEYYNAALVKGLAEDWIYYQRGLLYSTQMKEYSLAESDFLKAIKMNPEMADAYYQRGMLKKDQLNNPYAALSDFKKAAEIYTDTDRKKICTDLVTELESKLNVVDTTTFSFEEEDSADHHENWDEDTHKDSSDASELKAE